MFSFSTTKTNNSRLSVRTTGTIIALIVRLPLLPGSILRICSVSLYGSATSYYIAASIAAEEDTIDTGSTPARSAAATAIAAVWAKAAVRAGAATTAGAILPPVSRRAKTTAGRATAVAAAAAALKSPMPTLMA